MKSFFAVLPLASGFAGAAIEPIEPITVPVVSEQRGINVQMAKYEVTIEEFRRFVDATGYQVAQKCMLFSATSWPSPEAPKNWDHPDLVDNPFKPVSCIGIPGALAYASWLSEATGKPYRLPSRHEWEYAALQGKTSRFAFGEDFAQTEICQYENVEDFATVSGVMRDHGHRYESSAQCNDGAVYQTIVGMYRPNEFNLHDMIGNVRELLQSCHKTDEADPEVCIEYELAGDAWHWQARGVGTPDAIQADFHGSIEGFRLVLEGDQKSALSTQTMLFQQRLAEAQTKARAEQQKLKSLPAAPTQVKVDSIGKNQAQVSWQAEGSAVQSYNVYRSYLDPTGIISRKWQKVAEGLTTNTYLDSLPGSGVASYRVFANNAYGESPASQEVQTGASPIFVVNQKIEAEQYAQARYIWIDDGETYSAVGLSDNENHYATGQIPFLPAWLTFRFTSEKAGDGLVEVRVSGESGATFEIWQGHHLVARETLAEEKGFFTIITKARWIAGDYDLEVRSANQKWFKLDWLLLSS